MLVCDVEVVGSHIDFLFRVEFGHCFLEKVADAFEVAADGLLLLGL